jgi:hypothetical protein
MDTTQTPAKPTTTHAHIADYADAILRDGNHDAMVGGRWWTTNGDQMWDYKKGGRCYSIDAVKSNGTDPRQRLAIERTAAMAERNRTR